MSSKKIKVALMDYGMGNLRSVAKALEKSGSSVLWRDSSSGLKSCDAMVLPGVGSFTSAVENLRSRKLFGAISDWISSGRPFLGICLGYQLLFERSQEGVSKRSPGLGIFRGLVKRFPNKTGLKIPHIGWNQVRIKSEGDGFFNGILDGSYFYFVHSYFPVPEDKELVFTETRYGVNFASSICRKNLFASQFHPEKSGETGLKLLGNFLKCI